MSGSQVVEDYLTAPCGGYIVELEIEELDYQTTTYTYHNE